MKSETALKKSFFLKKICKYCTLYTYAVHILIWIFHWAMCYMETNKSTILNDLVSHVYTHVRAGVHAHTCTDGICVINTYRHIQTCSIQSLVLHVYMYVCVHVYIIICTCMYMSVICIHAYIYIHVHTCSYYSWPWYKTNVYLYNSVCLLVRSCCLTQRYQSKSPDEISLNPIVPRDRQSTLRFENLSRPSEKKNLAAKKKLFGIILM